MHKSPCHHPHIMGASNSKSFATKPCSELYREFAACREADIHLHTEHTYPTASHYLPVATNMFKYNSNTYNCQQEGLPSIARDLASKGYLLKSVTYSDNSAPGVLEKECVFSREKHSIKAPMTDKAFSFLSHL